MDYEFLDTSIEKENIILPNSDRINPFLLKNDSADIIKAVDFIASEEKFLYIHGFIGTGKRQFVNYVCEFLNRDVIKLEYYCKEATVCDDILLSFIDTIDELSISKAVNLNAKITTLNVKFEQHLSSIKKPFLIILHSFDDIQESNADFVRNCMASVSKLENVKIIVTTRGMNPSVLGNLDEDRKIALKGFSKDIFKEFLFSQNTEGSDRAIEDFYELTRGYYYYSALSVKIIQAMNISLSEFIQKHKQSGMSFDSYLGATYVNLIPTAIRNFFWFLRTIRHGISLNALAIFELYDEFSLNYLKTNLMIFQSGENIYVQDYFLQKIDISIPEKVQIKLHKYIIGIYEKQLKESLKDRCISISRQALRAEIEYHNSCISILKHENSARAEEEVKIVSQEIAEESLSSSQATIVDLLNEAKSLVSDNKNTEAIEKFISILDLENLDLSSLIEVRSHLAKLYKKVGEYKKSAHYYELLETYYIQHNEVINLNYLYYDMTDLYFKMYKNQRAVDTIKKVIYSVDTPQSLMVEACTLLGNIYSEMGNASDAFIYYEKALQSLDENVDATTLAELYFKYALSNDDKGLVDEAMDYYNKCIALNSDSYKALAYSNLASCYYEDENYDDARACYQKAYDIEKSKNNYEGVFYIASKLAQIYIKNGSNKAVDFLVEAKKSAEFINEELFILEASLALGDYYYDMPHKLNDGLKEYFKAKSIAAHLSNQVDISLIERRINDMRLRMSAEEFTEIERKYDK